MRLGIVICIATIVFAGCASEPVAPSSIDRGDSSTPSTEVSGGADIPTDDQSLQHRDAAGLLPEESALAVIEALNKSYWRTAYSLYASPTVDLATASLEWADAHETYLDFRVIEVRVTAPNKAWVRVTYVVTSDPTKSSVSPLIVGPPGEWWPLQKVDGVWKTQWMPRQ